MNRAQITGDTEQLVLASAPDCATCKTFVERIESVYGDGGSIRSSGLKILRVYTTEVEPRVWLVSIVVRSAAETITVPGQKDRFVRAERSRLNFTVEYDRTWTVDEVAIP